MKRRVRRRVVLAATAILLAGVGAVRAAPGDRLALEAGALALPVADAGAEAPAARMPVDWFKQEWAVYRQKFVTADGRILDNANGGISHSEGQGYGLLLALKAEDADTFATIWRWTVDHLQKRPDALFAWKWDPEREVVGDLNNASDGDILIAWALAKAARQFQRPDYEAAAQRIARAIAAKVVRPGRAGPLLLPGVRGFGAADQPAGPVVNLSYWVFAAFPELARLAPGTDWEGLRRSGLALIDQSRFGPRHLPTDWIALGGGKPVPAQTFPAEFGYNAIRIPLYLAWDSGASADTLARFADADAAVPEDPLPAVVDVATGKVRQPMDGAGYRMVFALARCAARREPVPAALVTARDDFYYPETLRLLSLSVVQERFPQCL